MPDSSNGLQTSSGTALQSTWSYSETARASTFRVEARFRNYAGMIVFKATGATVTSMNLARVGSDVKWMEVTGSSLAGKDDRNLLRPMLTNSAPSPTFSEFR